MLAPTQVVADYGNLEIDIKRGIREVIGRACIFVQTFAEKMCFEGGEFPGDEDPDDPIWL